ncbi:MAG TPA: hypothetical protein VFQ91_29050 [Bryobacteraceae bacterium]|nr:hypothetical protein [Bryobacteraceae bacterium]
MTDLFQFLFVVVVLYLCECFQKTGPAALVFASGRRIRPNLYPGNGTWGWIFCNPLRPYDAAFALDPPVRIPTGAGTLPNPRYSAAPLTFSAGTAMEKSLAAMFDEPAFTNQLTLYRQHARPLRTAGLLLVLTLALGWPVLAMWLGFGVSLGVVAVASYAIAAYGAVRFRRGYAALYPRRKSELFSETLKFVLYPFTLFRGPDHLAGPLCEGFDRSLGVRHLAPKEARPALYGELAREAAHPPVARLEPAQAAAVISFYEAWERAIRKVAQADGVTPAAACPQGAAAWCPVCCTDFQATGGACEDCGGVPLAVRR